MKLNDNSKLNEMFKNLIESVFIVLNPHFNAY